MRLNSSMLSVYQCWCFHMLRGTMYKSSGFTMSFKRFQPYPVCIRQHICVCSGILLGVKFSCYHSKKKKLCYEKLKIFFSNTAPASFFNLRKQNKVYFSKLFHPALPISLMIIAAGMKMGPSTWIPKEPEPEEKMSLGKGYRPILNLGWDLDPLT